MTIQSALSRRDALKLFAASSSTLALTSPALASVLNALAQDPDTLLKWYQIKPNHFAFVDLNTGGNVLLHLHEDRFTLVDTKYPHFAGAILDDAHTLFAHDHPPLTLINTHHHGDHTAGNGAVIPHANASYAHKNAIPRIQSQLDRFKQTAQNAVEQAKQYSDSKKLETIAQSISDDAPNWTNQTITPTTAVDKQATKIPSTDITLYHFGAGHTDNDLVVFFENDNVIHTGDLVFAGLHPFFDPSAGVTAKGWVNSLKKTLAHCDSKTTVIPGHGQPGDRSLITNQINYLEQLVEQVQKQIDAGTTKEAVAEMQWDFMDGLGFDRIRSRAINAVYDELSK
jgi:cyclase